MGEQDIITAITTTTKKKKHHSINNNRGNRKKKKKDSKKNKKKHTRKNIAKEFSGTQKYLLAIGSILMACQDRSGSSTCTVQALQGGGGGSQNQGVFNKHQDQNLLHQHPCSDLYLAPSKIGGWGVYAARDFAESEIVEIIPRFIVLQNKWYQQNVLDDYHYTFLWMGDPDENAYGVVVFGHGSFYNHAVENNVMFTHFGHEPIREYPMYAPALGYTALRDIKRGEEILASYGDGDEWFTARGLELLPPAPPPEDLSPEELDQRERTYCSKVYAGYGHPTWLQRVIPTQQHVDESRVPVFDHDARMAVEDHPTAVAKVSVKAGDVLEIAPALVAPMDQVQNSPFAPLGIFWHDWDDQQKEALERLREAGAWRMKGRDEEGYMTWDVLEYYDDAVVLPIAGNLGLVRKVGRSIHSDSNCRMEIVQANNDQDDADIGSAGLVLKLIATRDMPAGEELRLNLPDRSTWAEKKSLLQNLAMTGQPIPPYLANPKSQQEEEPLSDELLLAKGGEL